MLTSILQLMFNAVVYYCGGKVQRKHALAAVGSTTALINIFTNLFIGISLGANVLAARYYAAGRDKGNVRSSTYSHCTGSCQRYHYGPLWEWGRPGFALELMDTPADVIDQSVLYMRIYFMGMPFFMLYNYGAAILRAVGDTKRPLLFLLAAG